MSDTPALQPGQFEHELFVYGNSQLIVLVRRETAEKAAQGYIGRELILPGQVVRVVSVRLEDDPAYPDKRGRVMAICEFVSKIEQIEPRPFKPEMEYK